MHNIYLWWAIRLSLEMSDGFKGCLNEKSSLNSVWYNLIRKIKKKNNYQPLVFTNYIPLEVIILFLNNQYWFQFSSVAQSCPTLRLSESQHAMPPCPSPTSGVHSNSHPSSRWCQAAISSSVVPFSSCPQSLPASESFPMSQLLHEVAKILEFQLQHQSLQWTPRTDLLKDGLVGSPCSPRDSQESSPTPQLKSTKFFSARLSSQSNSHIHTWPLEKP